MSRLFQILLILSAAPLFGADCVSQTQKLRKPPMVLEVGSDNRLHMVGQTALTRPLGKIATAMAGPWWLTEMSDVIEAAANNRKPILMADKMLEALNIRYATRGLPLGEIPAQGPLVIVANHPRFGVEGLALTSLLSQVRPDVKIAVNQMMLTVPGFKEMAIGVNKDVSSQERSQTTKEMRQWLSEGHALIIFPAGEPSRMNREKGYYDDAPWSRSVPLLARRYQAPVLPIHVSGNQPGIWFRLTDRFISKPVKSIYPMEILRQQGQTIDLTLGNLIHPDELKEQGSEQAVEYLRERTYSLAPK